MGRRESLAWTTAVLIAWATLGGCSGCRPESPPGVVAAVEAPSADSQDADRATEGAEEAAEGDETRGRQLWFSEGLGREAILARERRDYEEAAAKLDALLAQPDLGVDDRGAAQWLRGLEDLRVDRYVSAADRFAEARKAPALAPVSNRLTMLEAQARLDGGQPDRALELVEGLDEASVAGTPMADDLMVIRADARARTDDRAGAIEAYERYLEHFGTGGRRRFEVQAKLARVLSESDGVASWTRAIELYESLLLASPLSDYGAEAERELPELRKRAKVALKGKAAATFARALELARVDALLERRRYRETEQAADRLLRRSLTPEDKCRVLYAKGSAVFRQRRRADSRPAFMACVGACKKSKQEDLEVKCRYQGGRAFYAEGHYARAAEAFETLATSHPNHSYVDDAWVLAGESWSEAGEADQAKQAFTRAIEDVPNGDKFDEARRRLLLTAFAQKDLDAVEALVSEGLSRTQDSTAKAKLLYFRGKAAALGGDPARARASWLEVLDVEPLGYPALLALSRLRELGADALQEGRTRLTRATEESLPSLDPPPAAERALLLARLGLGEEAAQELALADVEGWPAVAVLNQAGLYSAGQRLLASMGSQWRARPPSSATRRYWELAFPRPFASLIAPYEREFEVPGLLTFGVMQTESRFDPGVTSWAGARGLVQLMPATAEGLAKRAGLELGPSSLFDPSVNLSLGTRYLGELVHRFGGDEAAAALAVPSYNAGAGSVGRWLDERGEWDLDLFVEAIPYDETRAYTQRVLGRWFVYRWLYAKKDEDRIPYLPLELPKP